MKNNPLVSIIIPLYNAENYIIDCISSLLQQTYKEIEIVIVDDGSSDNSLSIARQYESEIVHVYSQKNKGACAARNYGFEMSKGEYVQFMDADDTIEKNKIELQIERLRSFDFDTKMLAFCRWQFIEDNNRTLDCHVCKDYFNPIDFLIDLILNQTWMYPHAYLVPREIVESVGGWDVTILKNQDAEFFSRVIESAKGLLFVDNTAANYRAYTPGSLSKGMSYAKQESFLSVLIRISEIIRKSNNLSKDIAVKKNIQEFIEDLYPYYNVLCKRAMDYLTSSYPDQEFSFPRRSLARWSYYYLIKLGIIHCDRVL